MNNFFDGRKLSELRSWLNLIDDSVCIEKDSLEKILGEMKEKYFDYTSQSDRACNMVNSKTMIELSAEMMRRQLFMDRDEFADLLTRLYEKAEAVKNYKVSQLDDIRFCDKINAMRDAEMNAEAHNGGTSG